MKTEQRTGIRRKQLKETIAALKITGDRSDRTLNRIDTAELELYRLNGGKK